MRRHDTEPPQARSLRDMLTEGRVSGAQVRSELHVTERTLYKWRRLGLPMIRFDRDFWVKPDDLKAFIAGAPARRAAAAAARMPPPRRPGRPRKDTRP